MKDIIIAKKEAYDEYNRSIQDIINTSLKSILTDLFNPPDPMTFLLHFCSEDNQITLQVNEGCCFSKQVNEGCCFSKYILFKYKIIDIGSYSLPRGEFVTIELEYTIAGRTFFINISQDSYDKCIADLIRDTFTNVTNINLFYKFLKL